MSHTTTVNDIVITDVQALRSAVARLSRAGINISLVEDDRPRAYSRNQSGMSTNAEYCVKIPDASYDVGLYRTEDGKGLEARTDFYGGSVERVLGSQHIKGTTQGKLGKLYQAYSVEAVKRQAMKQGFSVSEVTKEDGRVQLRLA